MKKTQMYFPISPEIKRRLYATANHLSIPASNIVSEIITEAFDRPNLDIKIKIPSIHATTNQEIEDAVKDFDKGDHGKKHHLID